MNVQFGVVLHIHIPILLEDAVTGLTYKTRFFRKSVNGVGINMTGMGEANRQPITPKNWEITSGNV